MKRAYGHSSQNGRVYLGGFFQGVPDAQKATKSLGTYRLEPGNLSPGRSKRYKKLGNLSPGAWEPIAKTLKTLLKAWEPIARSLGTYCQDAQNASNSLGTYHLEPGNLPPRR